MSGIGEIKVRKKPTCRLGMAITVKNRKDHQDQWLEGLRTCRARSMEPRWGSLGTRGSRYRRSIGLANFPTTSDRLKRATRKSTMLRGAINKVSILIEISVNFVVLTLILLVLEGPLNLVHRSTY